MILFHYYSFDPSSGARPKTARAMSSQQSLGDEEDIANKHICIYNLQVHNYVCISIQQTDLWSPISTMYELAGAILWLHEFVCQACISTTWAGSHIRIIQ